MNASEHYRAGEEWLDKADKTAYTDTKSAFAQVAQARFAAATAWVEMVRFERECNPAAQNRVAGSSEEILSWSTK